MSYCLTASISHMPFQLYDYATSSPQLLLRPHTMQDLLLSCKVCLMSKPRENSLPCIIAGSQQCLDCTSCAVSQSLLNAWSLT